MNIRCAYSHPATKQITCFHWLGSQLGEPLTMWSTFQFCSWYIFCVCEKIKRQSRISHQCDLGSTLKITGTIAQSWMWIQKNWTLAQLTPAGRVPRTRTLTLLNFSCFLWWGIKPFGPADLIVLWGSIGTSRKAPQMIIMIANIFKTFFFFEVEHFLNLYWIFCNIVSIFLLFGH